MIGSPVNRCEIHASARLRHKGGYTSESLDPHLSLIDEIMNVVYEFVRPLYYLDN
jgi:hypothetical protein